MAIRAIVIWMWIFNFHSGPLLVMWFTSWSTGVQVWPMWILSWGFVGWSWMWQASISGVVWWTSVHEWSVVWSMWSITVRSMAVTPVCGIGALWATAVMMALLPMSWSRTASIGIMMTWAVVSVKLCLRPWTALPVPVLIVVSGTWSGMVTFVWFALVTLCWGSQRRNLCVGNPLQCDHTCHIPKPNVWAISCYMTMFLALETSIFTVCHHVDCRWWSDGGSQLLYSIKLFNFGYCIVEGLWSLLIYVGG